MTLALIPGYTARFGKPIGAVIEARTSADTTLES